MVEVASNDGYLLQHVVAAGVPCLGIEPSVNVGAVARERGVPTIVGFSRRAVGPQVRAEHGPADLVVANNVYAHIPDLLGFTRALRGLVSDNGWLSIEVHHALKLVNHGQFDTIYHEHFSTTPCCRRPVRSPLPDWPSSTWSCCPLTVVRFVSGRVPRESPRRRLNGWPRVLRVERRRAAPRRGISATAPANRGTASRVVAVPASVPRRRQAGGRLRRAGQGQHAAELLRYPQRPARVHRRPQSLQTWPLHARHAHPDLHPELLAEDRPDVVLALPWNLEAELTEQLSYIADWGGQLVFPFRPCTRRRRWHPRTSKCETAWQRPISQFTLA